MKSHPNPQSPRPATAARFQPLPASERGAALLAALCFATILAISLTSYTTLCYRTLALSTRSVQSTRAVELAENGLEDAIWSLNENDWSAWTISGTTATKTVTGNFNFEGNATGSIAVTVTNYNLGTRTITASGTVAQADGTTLSRTLTTSAAPAPLFVNAVASTTGRVKFKVAGLVDSYNSTLGDYSAQTPGYSAILSSGSTSTTSATVQLTNIAVHGYVATLSTGPSYSTSALLVGPTTPGTTKIDTSRISTSPYQPIFDENVPTGTSTLLPGGTTTIGTAGGASALYSAGDVILSGGQILTVNGPVVLSISGNLYISDTSQIAITATGSLEIHLAGDLAVDGNGILNATKLPKNCSIICKKDNIYDSLELGTTVPFYGIIYAPNNAVTTDNSPTIYGALVVKSLTANNSPSIHYDVSLRNTSLSGITTPFAVSNWREPGAGD